MRNVIWGLLRDTICERVWKPFLVIDWNRFTPVHGRRYLLLVGGVVLVTILVLCADYFGFFKMVDFYLYENY